MTYPLNKDTYTTAKNGVLEETKIELTTSGRGIGSERVAVLVRRGDRVSVFIDEDSDAVGPGCALDVRHARDIAEAMLEIARDAK